MPDESDPRYRGTGPPTLEQLRALLRCASVESKRTPDGKYSEIRFKIDNQKLYDSGGSYFGTDSQIYAGFLDVMDRITEFEDITKRYADHITGVTCDDMIVQFRRDLSSIRNNGLLEVLQRAMFENAIKKMEELKEWRRAADAKRHERERAQREQMRKDKERREEEALKERQRKEKEWKEAHKEYNKEDAESFWKDFENAFGGDQADWARQYQQQWRSAFGDAFSQGRGNNRQRSQYEQQQQRPKARNKGRAPWFVVLGVPPNSDKATIKSAWRKLASDLHPDKPGNRTPEKLEKLKDVNTAKDEGLRGLG